MAIDKFIAELTLVVGSTGFLGSVYALLGDTYGVVPTLKGRFTKIVPFPHKCPLPPTRHVNFYFGTEWRCRKCKREYVFLADDQYPNSIFMGNWQLKSLY